MTMIEKFVDAMKKGDNIALADLFGDYGVLHDSSLIKIGMDVMHLEGKMAVEMMFHNKFGFNRGPFNITGINYHGENMVCYFIEYGGRVIPVTATILAFDKDGKIARMNIYPL